MTINIEKDTATKYRNYCKNNGLRMSRRIEILMEDEIHRDKPF